jgi:hypothetical protein
MALSTGAMAAPDEGLRNIQSFAYANFYRPLDECTQVTVWVAFVAGDNLQGPIGSGKPGSWSDVTVRLELIGTCEGSESTTFEGYIPVPPDMETFEHARVDGAGVSLTGGADETVDVLVDLSWTGLGDETVSINQHDGYVRAERSVTAEVDGSVTFGANDRWGEGLEFTPTDVHDGRMGWASEIDTLARPPCAPAPAGLTSWWTGDGMLDDRVGGFDAVARGDARYGQGLVRSAFSLDGDGDWLRVADDPGLDVGSADFTVSAWVRFDDIDGEQVLVEKWVQNWDEVQSEGWTLTKLDDQSILLAVSAADGYEADARTEAGLIEPDRWYHVVGRRAGSEIALFVDSLLLASVPLEGASGWDLSTEQSLLIGRRSDDRGLFLDGAIDEVQLYNGTALSDSDIWLQHSVGPAGVCRQS